MGIFHRTVVALAAALSISAPVQAAGPAAGGVEASLNWQLGFGGRTLQSGYSLALGYRAQDLDAPRARLLALNADGQQASATLAGLPLYARSYRANQSGEPETAGAESGPTSWYTHSWVLWTVGGLAATAALIGGVSSSGSNGSDGHGTSVQTNNSRVCAVSGGNVGPQQTPDSCVARPTENTGCVGDTCVVCARGSIVSSCGGYAARRRDARGEREVLDELWVSEDTGGMGDLEAAR